MQKTALCLLFSWLLMAHIIGQELSVNQLFSDHTVLQRNTSVPIWGRALPNTLVDVTTSWGARASARSNGEGDWLVSVNTPGAGGPFTIDISDESNRITIDDVLIGEVWLCSGQSNMAFHLKGQLPDEPVEGSEEAILSADFPMIREFSVKKKLAITPQKNVEGIWAVCSPETAGDFSATAFFFARKLHKELNVPIGLINSSWGGTPAEAWTELDALKTVVGFEEIGTKFEELTNSNSAYNLWMGQLDQVDLEEFRNNYDNLTNTDYLDVDYQDEHWASMEIPNRLNGSMATFDGVIWFRKSFEISEVDENADYNLLLGGIDDEDITYVNGTKVGMTKNWMAQRNYSLPKGLLRAGKNVIAIRLFDGESNGGIYGGQEMGIKRDGELLYALSGDWKYLPEAILRGGKLYYFSDEQAFAKIPRPSLTVNNQLPTGLYNGMIHPLIPYSIRGVIWYQGENNVGRAKQYSSLFSTMINSWRNNWGKAFSFYFTQIAPFRYSGVDNSESAELRFAQNQTLSLPQTGQAVTLDIGKVESIHPPNKKDVGERLALWALAKDYEKESVAFSGPVCKSARLKGDQVILHFDIGAETLVAGKSGLKEFEMIFADGTIMEAQASINRGKVVLKNTSKHIPIAVRYAWKNGSEAALFNSAGLPASTFFIALDN